MEKKAIVEYELILDTKNLPQGDDEKLINYVIDLESVIKEKVEEIKLNQIEEIGEAIKKGDLPVEVLINNEFTIHKHPVGVNGEEFIVDVRLVKVLSHHKVRIKIPAQVLKTDEEGNIDKDDGAS